MTRSKAGAGFIGALLAGLSMPSLALAADMILTNGKVFTANTAAPSAEAVAIRDGNILAVGKLADVEKAASADAEKIDLDGGA